ncbi:hypothetical protein EV681_4200 [Advenella incenata]|jgi:hypothetical protein|uniref:Uncharacterized protein n=1 Tax=Advenella incenata TaxID=267800 RepID=A0A4Q7VC41_9BURK|nr:hypothetical protein EV681_4200 [Advenella incenata]
MSGIFYAAQSYLSRANATHCDENQTAFSSRTLKIEKIDLDQNFF